METFTLAQIEAATGARRRSVQLWADRGVIRADPITDNAGSGTHRRFSVEEVAIACAIAGFAKRQSPIGRLFKLAHELRRSILPNEDCRHILNAAIEGLRPVFLIVRSWGGTQDDIKAQREFLRDGKGLIHPITAELARYYFMFSLQDNFGAVTQISLFQYSSFDPDPEDYRVMGQFATEILGEEAGFTEILRLDKALAPLR